MALFCYKNCYKRVEVTDAKQDATSMQLAMKGVDELLCGLRYFLTEMYNVG